LAAFAELTRNRALCYHCKLTNIRPLRFTLIFAGCLLIGFGVLLTPPVQSVDGQFSRALVSVSHGLIRMFGGHATRNAAILRAPGGFAVEMRDGCNAVNVSILLWSAVLAFPATWKMKAIGLLAGTAIVQVVNVFRFITLYYLGQYSMTWFDFAHAYLWESLIMLDTMVIFWFWVTRVLRAGAAPHAPA
jgi:exosortase H (IPTLxxWG-CTERM-specific)